MIVAPLNVTFLASSMMANQGRRRAAASPTASPTVPVAGVDPQYIEESTGLIKSWKGASEVDSTQLR